jgi:hypothetical protein
MRRRAAPICVIVALAACGGGSKTGFTVADSAGVRIVLTADADRTFASVDPEPVMSLGGPDVSGPTQFSHIAGVHLDPRGNLWVADGGSAELRLFRPDGTHWKTRGGQGAGPGEFRQLRFLGALRGDSVACWDWRLARLTVFDAEGELARTTRMPPGADAVPRAYDVFPDGSLLVQFPRMIAGQSLQPGQLLRDTAHLERLEPAMLNRQPLASAQGAVWVWTGHGQVPLPFTINSSFALDGEALHLVAGTEFRVRVLQRGRLTEIYGVARSPREATERDLATYAAWMEDALPQPQRRDYLSVLDHAARPRLLPAYYQVLVANDGAVWARIYSPDLLGAATWDVFDRERRWLGQVRTPTGLMVDEVKGDSLVGVWRDTSGVEYVHIYRMRHL